MTRARSRCRLNRNSEEDMGIKSEVKKFMDGAYTAANGPKDVSITLPAKYLRKHWSEAEINDLIDELISFAQVRVETMKRRHVRR